MTNFSSLIAAAELFGLLCLLDTLFIIPQKQL